MLVVECIICIASPMGGHSPSQFVLVNKHQAAYKSVIARLTCPGKFWTFRLSESVSYRRSGSHWR